MSFWGYKAYVPVAKRREKAAAKLAKLNKKGGFTADPVKPEERRTIATSFWGKAWCEHMESFSDFENRLPRGRTYIRNGSVVHLEMGKGGISAMVSGSSLYEVNISINELLVKEWNQIKEKCAGNIASLVELMQGRLSDSVMAVVTDAKAGLFPRPGQMEFSCSCPDWAVMCKHVAATLYGVAVRLDRSPEMLFTLRGVNSHELVDVSAAVQSVTKRAAGGVRTRRLASVDLGKVFDIDLGANEDMGASEIQKRRGQSKQKVETAVVTEQKKRGRPAKKQVATKGFEKKATIAGLPEKLTGSQLKRFRLSLNMTQVQFAAWVKVSTPSVIRWEQAGRKALALNRPTRNKLTAVWKCE